MHTRTVGNPTEVTIDDGRMMIVPCPSLNGDRAEVLCEHAYNVSQALHTALHIIQRETSTLLNGRNFQMDSNTRNHTALALNVETLRMAMQLAAIQWDQRARVLADEVRT